METSRRSGTTVSNSTKPQLVYIHAGNVCFRCPDKESLERVLKVVLEKGYVPIITSPGKCGIPVEDLW